MTFSKIYNEYKPARLIFVDKGEKEVDKTLFTLICW